MEEQKFAKAKWYTDLCDNFNEICQKTGIDEDTASEIKVFLLGVARNQYLAGNRSGIRWAREQMSAKA